MSKSFLIAAVAAVLLTAGAAYAADNTTPGVNGSGDTQGGGSAMSMDPGNSSDSMTGTDQQAPGVNGGGEPQSGIPAGD